VFLVQSRGGADLCFYHSVVRLPAPRGDEVRVLFIQWRSFYMIGDFPFGLMPAPTRTLLVVDVPAVRLGCQRRTQLPKLTTKPAQAGLAALTDFLPTLDDYLKYSLGETLECEIMHG